MLFYFTTSLRKKQAVFRDWRCLKQKFYDSIGIDWKEDSRGVEEMIETRED